MLTGRALITGSSAAAAIADRSSILAGQTGTGNLCHGFCIAAKLVMLMQAGRTLNGWGVGTAAVAAEVDTQSLRQPAGIIADVAAGRSLTSLGVAAVGMLGMMGAGASGVSFSKGADRQHTENHNKGKEAAKRA